MKCADARVAKAASMVKVVFILRSCGKVGLCVVEMVNAKAV